MSERPVRRRKGRSAIPPVRVALASSRYFRDLPAASLDRMAASMRVRRLANGEAVRAEGDDHLWFVIAGALRLSLLTEESTAPTLAVFGVGSFYNVGTFLGQPGTPTECHAIGDTVLGVMAGSVMRRLLDDDAQLRKTAGKLLMDRLTASISFYNDMIHAPVPQRLARRLISQAITTNRVQGETEVRLSQGTLAEMLGTSRTRVSEELKLLEQAHVVRLGYRRLYIRDMAKLCELAGPGVLPL